MKLYFIILRSYWLVKIFLLLTKVEVRATNLACNAQVNGTTTEKECLIVNAISDSLLTDIGTETAGVLLTLTGTASVIPVSDDDFEIASNLNISKVTTVDCPSLDDADQLPPNELIERLTASCRYDRMERPTGPILNDSDPVVINARIYVYVLQNAGSSFQFSMQALLQLRYVDPRLAFDSIAPQRQQPIQGEAELRDLIWVPHLFFANEQDSSVLGTFEKDILTTIAPNGTVMLATRIEVTLFCWLQLQKFPFDEQYCTTTLESWMYNSLDLVLIWETETPISFNPNMQFTHYALDESWHNESLSNPIELSMWHGGYGGNYSSISFTVHMVHSAGYYIMDFFIPTMIMVAITWANFWIRADQTPSRTILNCSTLVTFITLSASQLRTSSSFITIIEIWFLGCCAFIFCSMLEFAFSYQIYIRKKDVQLKKVTSRCILKSAVRPKPICDDCSPNDCIQFTAQTSVISSVLSVNSIDTLKTAPSTNSLTLRIENDKLDLDEPFTPTPTTPPTPPKPTFATMTPQEISLWVDKKARFIFPVAFIIFNAFFWMFVLIL